MPRRRRPNIGRRTRHARQQQAYSQNFSKERQNIIREKARLSQRVSTRRSLTSYNRLAFQYDPSANYSDDDYLDVGPVKTVHRYYKAIKFKRETAGLCCASGKVKLDQLLTPLQPLKPLFDGSDPDSNNLLQPILEYNNCLCTTSFGSNIIREGGFMPTCKFGEHVSQLEANIAKVQQKMLEEADHSDIEIDDPLPPPPTDEKRGRGRPRKHKPAASTSADGATPRKRGRPKKDQNSLEEDLQYSDSGSSELEEVEQKDGIVQLSVKPEDDLLPSGDTPFDTSEFLIKREVPDEPPQMSTDLVDLDASTDYTFPTVVKEEPIDIGFDQRHMDPPMMESTSIEPPQFKEEPPENWQPDPAIQDDLQVTDSEEEPEDGLWF